MRSLRNARGSFSIVTIVLMLILSGCAVAMNTPQQDYTWEMGRICDAKVSFYKMERVGADGRYWVRGTTNIPPGMNDYLECMKQQFATHPFLDWVKAHKRDAQAPPVGIGATSTSAPTAPSGPITVPVWEVGDEWQYAYKGATESGTYAVTVIRMEALDGVNHYVVRSGTRESYYRVSDLAFSVERSEGAIVTRDVPPRLNFDWPLTIGKSWEQAHRIERPADRLTSDRKSRWTVDKEEVMTVPAGTFRAVKITWKNAQTNADIAETWYAPNAKQWIKMREFRRAGIRDREMFAFKLKTVIAARD